MDVWYLFIEENPRFHYCCDYLTFTRFTDCITALAWLTDLLRMIVFYYLKNIMIKNIMNSRFPSSISEYLIGVWLRVLLLLHFVRYLHKMETLHLNHCSNTIYYINMKVSQIYHNWLYSSMCLLFKMLIFKDIMIVYNWISIMFTRTNFRTH